MIASVTQQQLLENGLPAEYAENQTEMINFYLKNLPPEQAWRKISNDILSPLLPFKLHLFLFSITYPDWLEHPESAAAFIPETRFIKTTNISKFMTDLKIKNLSEFHVWSVRHFEMFWEEVTRELNIIFKNPYTRICDLSQGAENPQWFVDAKLNITDSCFSAPPLNPAIVYLNNQKKLITLTYEELNNFSNRIANSLEKMGFTIGDAIAIDMPFTVDAVAIYLGIIKIGGIVVSIADSFSIEEINTRLRITNSKIIFTQDVIFRGAKKIPLYEKVIAATSIKAIVISSSDITLRSTDQIWNDFLIDNTSYESKALDPMAYCNILFSSGTTSDPKAIPWTHSTPIKIASDAFFHQNIQAGDVLTWPTSLGWMMGPWLIFAALMNHACIAVYSDVPHEKPFGEFIQNAKVTMLGVVPTLVATWKRNQSMQGLDWSHIKVLSSTGECSNSEDMLYLMSLANYKPIIEYCGGTEIGGSYITSTVIQNNCPAVFSTPTMGSAFLLLDEKGIPSDIGEVALIPPALGLSTQLLNANHHDVYFSNMPVMEQNIIIRRHGDQARRFSNGYYCVLGRVDDTMNLSGIKISSAEIERALVGIESITETAAVAIPPLYNGPSQLVIYAATNYSLDKKIIQQEMQKKVNEHLNPLFKIKDVILLKELPKTASNKIMRRLLRKEYKVTD